jgi:Ca2+-binding EF-hand superfamily protein
MRSIPVAVAVSLAAALIGTQATAQDKAAYEQRNIARYVDLFAWLDSDHDGAVSRLEASGDIDFTIVFDDMDINRDGIVTKAELDRFLTLRYAVAERSK